METTGLTRGNLLDVDGNHWTVDSISNDELYFKENQEYNHILNAKPIPLTEEWYDKFPDWFSNLIIEGYMNFDCLPSGHVNVVFVHTAQNLYHALTDEELIES